MADFASGSTPTAIAPNATPTMVMSSESWKARMCLWKLRGKSC